MAASGVCCASLEDPKTLMKMGLSMVLIGHVNFLLGALVHGVVLRHINLHKQARAMEYAISNVFAFTSGLVGIVVGILAIVLSKNKKSRGLTWSLFTVALAAALMAAASAIGLFVSMVRAIIHGGRSLLTHCRFPDAIGYSSITNECPFDPTRIYSTTLILWVPLIVTCVIQMVFSARCSAVCASFLGLPCCPTRKRARDFGRSINAVRPLEEATTSRYTEPPTRSTEVPRSHREPPRRGTEPPRRTTEPPRRNPEPPRRNPELPRRNTEPPRQQRRPPPPPQSRPHQQRSLSPSERRPLRQPYRERSNRERQDTSVGSLQRAPEEHQLLERGTLERSSFWI
ncbi:transmembrane protein 54-like [Centropristis striata]|uniref:transmembrane protein 54-like n=1 Tax=Centropristis striata TaxID=184440 RepID=UPI0027E14D5D|nr:transmembrane protein 54-like [Centropristis striata]